MSHPCMIHSGVVIVFAVYRASFCQTFAEMKAPTGEWKSILAAIFTALAVTGWIVIYMKKFGNYSVHRFISTWSTVLEVQSTPFYKYMVSTVL